MGLRPEHMRAFAYLLLNILSGTGIVFANKLVLSVLGFHFVRLAVLRRACPWFCEGAAYVPVPRRMLLCWRSWHPETAAPAGVRADVRAQRGDHVWDVDLCCRWHVRGEGARSMAGARPLPSQCSPLCHGPWLSTCSASQTASVPSGISSLTQS